IEPKVLFAADGYVYAGKPFDCLARVAEIAARIPSLEHVVIVPYSARCSVAESARIPDATAERNSCEFRYGEKPSLSAIPNAVWFDELPHADAGAAPYFEQLPFDHP